jgi:hypothetical protein
MIPSPIAHRKAASTIIAVAWMGLASTALCAAPQTPKPATDVQIINAVDHKRLTETAYQGGANQVFNNITVQ